MNTQSRVSECDRRTIQRFLQGGLSDVQEQSFIEHLNTCQACRTSLESETGEPLHWNEAAGFLRTHEFDAASDEISATEYPNPQADLPHSVQAVLDSLAPTDDPRMLGRLGTYEISGVIGAGGMGKRPSS